MLVYRVAPGETTKIEDWIREDLLCVDLTLPHNGHGIKLTQSSLVLRADLPGSHRYCPIPGGYKHHRWQRVLSPCFSPSVRYCAFPHLLRITLRSTLLSGTQVVWGINLRESNITAAFLEARAISQAFASSSVKNAGVTLEALEIGNEADFYAGTPQNYVAQ